MFDFIEKSSILGVEHPGKWFSGCNKGDACEGHPEIF